MKAAKHDETVEHLLAIESYDLMVSLQIQCLSEQNDRRDSRRPGPLPACPPAFDCLRLALNPLSDVNPLDACRIVV